MKFQLTQLGDIYTIIKDGQQVFSSKDELQCVRLYDKMVKAARENKYKLGVIREDEI